MEMYINDKLKEQIRSLIDLTDEQLVENMKVIKDSKNVLDSQQYFQQYKQSKAKYYEMLHQSSVVMNEQLQ